MTLESITPEPGVYPPAQVSMTRYHRQWNAVGRSALKILDEGKPADVIRYLEDGLPGTTSMNFGTALGQLLLEPDEFADRYIERPHWSGERAPAEFKGKGARERVAEWKEANQDKQWLEPGELSELHACARAVKASPTGAKLLGAQNLIEHSIVWEDKDTGLLCKCRPDAWIPSAGATWDLKVLSDDLSDRSICRYIVKYAADLQGAFNMRGLLANGFAFRSHSLLFVSRAYRKPMCRVVTWSLDDQDDPNWLELGEQKFDTFLAEWAACKRANHYPDHGDEGTTLSVPAYASIRMGSYKERLAKTETASETAA